MAKKSALGKGLGALIKQSETDIAERKVYASDRIDINLIEASPYQPRSNFDNETLEELAMSVKQLGIIQPITVREISDRKYQIVSGERRYRASLMAGLTEIPVYIRRVDDSNMLAMALVENIQREDLDPIEIAISYQRLIDECQLTQENLSEFVGKKRSTIANHLRLLKLPAEIQLAIRQGQISMGHAKALVNIEENDHQLQLFHQIIENSLSVRQVETAVRQMNHPDETEQTVTTPPDETSDEIPDETPISEVNTDAPSDDEQNISDNPQQPSENISGDKDEQQLKEQLSRCFGTKVDFKRNASGAGRIVIPFRTDAELNYILQMAENYLKLGNGKALDTVN